MTNYLSQEYKRLSVKFIKISLREQVLILFCGMAVVILMMYTFLLEPLLDNSERLKQNDMSATKEITSLKDQVTKLSDRLSIEPNEPMLGRIGALQRQIENIDTRLKTHTSYLVPANKNSSTL